MEIVGHKTQWQFLRQIVLNRKVPQAMIFTGMDGLGKKKVALEFIKFLNCQNRNSQGACQSCLSCKSIDRNQHPDLILLSSEKKEIQISQVRELQKALALRPRLSVFKSVIIDNAESLNSESQNCLLKTLEEPKGPAVLILITSRIDALFETIRSRCQILKFYPVPFEELEKSFQGQIPSEKLKKIFLLSLGEPGKVINFLKDSKRLSTELENFKKIEMLLNLTLSERFSFSQKFFDKEDSGQELNCFLETFENYLRLAFLKKIGLKKEIFNSFNLEIPEKYSTLKIREAINLVEDLKVLTSRTNINQKLAFENLMIALS